jgi:hypothetical protein
VIDFEVVRAKILSERYRAKDLPRADGPGVYALFLAKGSRSIGITGHSDVLYVGMTESSLDVRNHFTCSHSGFSSPRRSLGAVLKEDLRLRCIPRAPGTSKTNITNFRFQPDGEERLTEWMLQNLTCNVCPVERREIRSTETRLISELRPLLNLTGWRNPDARWLRVLRGRCRDEAGRAKGVCRSEV